MRIMKAASTGLTLLSIVFFLRQTTSGAEEPPEIKAIARPAAGYTEIIFHGPAGPFQVQTRNSLDPSAPWVDMPLALVTEIGTGVFMGQFPNGRDDLGFYRVVSMSDGIAELKGWTVTVRVSTPANGSYFVAGESPVVTVNILDNFAQGLTRTDFAALSLYMYGPQDPKKTVTAVKLLNASTNRSQSVHHYIDLKNNAAVQVLGNTLSYPLKPVTDEAPGSYTLSLLARLASDPIQQIFKFTDVQIGTATVESPVAANKAADGTAKCASCHLGPISGKTYMHHIDVSERSPVGNWAYDYEPVRSCKSCHNNDGYAAYSDTNAPGGRVPDPIIRRVHGVHMGEGLKLPFNTNTVNGDFRDYTHLIFPADVRNCTKCHLDNRWETQPTRMACGSCHDNVWFGTVAQAPPGTKPHTGGTVTDDNFCVVCHDSQGIAGGIAEAHDLIGPDKTLPPVQVEGTPGQLAGIDIALTPPANGKFYVAGEKPVVSLVFKNDTTNSIGDHRIVNSANFSTANLFVYGPRTRTLPVLTSTARLGIETRRASVTCSVNGPWAINGKTFKIGINGTPPQNITIVGASNLVTAAEFVASLNPVITNLNGGARASVSSGTRVNIQTLIRGANARIEIYNGEVTTAMGWKAKGVTLEPDVTVAAVSIPNNDLRPVTDPLNYNDPNVALTSSNILYQLDEISTNIAAGTYGVYAYYVPVSNKVAGVVKSLSGIGYLPFQVGTTNIEKKIATNCRDCHANTIFHLTEGPVHPALFDPDYCKACHDYSHPNTGEGFKNQGGTSLNGWSGYGAVPIVRRVHGVHAAHYLEHSEEIYANATKETFGNIIFPQDLRNCTKCHAESDAWKQEPSRLACLACHDDDATKTHAKLMTFIPDPSDPYGPSAIETCVICHEEGAAFAPHKVHSIANPYVPPYPREPEAREP